MMTYFRVTVKKSSVGCHLFQLCILTRCYFTATLLLLSRIRIYTITFQNGTRWVPACRLRWLLCIDSGHKLSASNSHATGTMSSAAWLWQTLLLATGEMTACYQPLNCGKMLLYSSIPLSSIIQSLVTHASVRY